MVSGNRLRRASAGIERFALLFAAVLRSAKSAHRAAVAQTSWIDWPQDGRGRDCGGLQRSFDERALRHVVARRISHRALFSQLDRNSDRGIERAHHVAQHGHARATIAQRYARHAQRDGSDHELSRSLPGGEWHPRDIMQMEMTACHSMLSLAANYRADYLRNFYELGKAGLASTPSSEPIAYLIPAGQGRDENVAKMIGALVEQGVEVYRLDKELHAITGTQYLRKLPNGSH